MPSVKSTTSAYGAVETVSAVEIASAAEPAANFTASAHYHAAGPESRAPGEAATLDEAAPSHKSRPAVKSAPVEPRTCADEYPAGEVARAVVTVRRASIRVITVVAVSADRSGADAHADYHSLRRSQGSATQENSKHREKS